MRRRRSRRARAGEPQPARRDRRRGASAIWPRSGSRFLLGAALVRDAARAAAFSRAGPSRKLLDLLDLVALGTVADVAQLTGLNRAFVAQGLKVMAARRNIGLAALIDASRG